MQVEITPNYLYVKVPYEQKETAKRIGAIAFDDKRKMWKFPNDIYMMRHLVRHFPQLQQNAQFMAYGMKKRENQDRLLAIKAQQDAPGDPRLRPYQRVDVAYLKELHAAGVFNEQRTGKTPTILATCRELGLQKVLIVCPASLVKNWEKEVLAWVGNVTVVIAKGSKARRQKLYQGFFSLEEPAFYCIVSYETLRNDIKSLSPLSWDAVIVDEAHRLRNRDTLQSKALHQLQSERRYALTGTPTVKDGTDLFGILQWLYPDRYTNYWAWVKRYFVTYQNHWGGMEIGDYRPDTQGELQELVGFISVQRKRKDVMSWLPEKSYIAIPVEMDTKQAKAYDDMLNDFVVETKDGEIVDAPTVLAQLTRLRQLCLDPGLLGIDAPSAKTEAILEWLEDNGGPVVIMSQFTSYLKRLQSLLAKKYRVATIHGEMTNHEKFKAAEAFQAGQVDVLLCNTISAGVGFTLDRADTIIFTDQAWNPADQRQAEDRIVPTDRSRNHAINIITFPIADTADDIIDEILQRKEKLTETINTGARDAILRLLKRKGK